MKHLILEEEIYILYWILEEEFIYIYFYFLFLVCLILEEEFISGMSLVLFLKEDFSLNSSRILNKRIVNGGRKGVKNLMRSLALPHYL